MSDLEDSGELSESDQEGIISEEPEPEDAGLQVSGSDSDDEEEYGPSSELSSRISNYSLGELHSAVVVAPVDDEDSLWDQLSSLSSSNVNDIPYGEDPVLTKQELIRQIHLRRHVNQLKRNLIDKEERVEEIREQLHRCIDQINDLNAQKLSLEGQVTHHQEEGKMASTGLVKTQLTKVKVEISSEEEVKTKLETQLREAELLLNEATLSAGQLEELEAGLVKGEELVQAFKEKKAAQRLKAEGRLVSNIEKSQRYMEKEFESSLHDHRAQTRTAVEQAREAQEKGKIFLHKTLEKRRKAEALAEKEHRQNLEKRMNAILSLKQNIDSSQGTIQALQMLKNKQTEKQKELEKKEREEILLSGGNPEEVFLMRQRTSQFEKEKQKFKAKQEERQLEIVTRLLEEEKIQKRMEKEQSKAHWHLRQQRPHPSKKDLHSSKSKSKKRRKEKVILEQIGGGEERDEPLVEATAEEGMRASEGYKDSSSDDEFSGEPFETITLKGKEGGESLQQPEYKGLWENAPVNKQQSVQSKAGDGSGLRREKSKAEVEMMKRTLDKLKKSAIIKQVAGGREFKGQAFLSKPEEVIFSDFEVGRSYKKKVQLTNVSYSINYCRLEGVSDNLKDFVKIDFNPPGSMSAGLTCHMTVTFQPKLNEDIYGSIDMASQTGYFSIPLHCLTKKCLIMADTTSVEFGSVCLGEKVSRRFTFRNEGAIPTRFRVVDKLSDVPSMPLLQAVEGGSDQGSGEPQPVVGGPLADKSSMSIMSNVEVPPSRAKKLVSGLAIGPIESEAEEMRSQSVGDLTSMSSKSLTISPTKREEGEVVKGDDPGDQGVDIEKAESIAALPQVSAIQLGGVSEGEIPGHSSRYVEFFFSPEEAIEHTAEFFINFDLPNIEPISVLTSGRGIDLPIYVEREEMDLRICMLDRLYQDSVMLHNRATTPFHVMFEVPPQLQPHLEVVPKHGLVQGQSAFAAQVKFLPKSSILESGDCRRFYDEAGGCYSMPVHIQVADQARPVIFSVSAIVTSSDLSFNFDNIDFGSCTIHESVVVAMEITNHSLLMQKFGFVHLPPCVEVQPNYGFGQLLPRETLAVDVIFSAKKPREYEFELTCKTGIDKAFKIPCKGMGILPALELSENVINFSPTPVNDRSTAIITVCNPRLSRLNSAVIRGAVLPQGPKMFEFVVPEDAPVSISPKVATVELGKSVNVQVEFCPKLKDSTIKEEAKKLVEEKLKKEEKQRQEALDEELKAEAASPVPTGKKGKKSASRDGEKPAKASLLSNSNGSLASSSKTLQPTVKLTTETPDVNSDLWWQAYHNLLETFDGEYIQVSVPCFISQSVAMATDAQTTPAYRPEDTLYLELSGAVVRPGLVVVSDDGRMAVNFDRVGTGDSLIKRLTVRNISDEDIQLRSSLLDPHGPFEICNALRAIAPGETQNIVLKFSPILEGKFYEPLKLFYGEGRSLELKVSGVGIETQVSLSPALSDVDGASVLDFGHAMANDTVNRTLQLHNTSPLGVRFEVQLESLLPDSQRKQTQHTFRASNYRAPPPFDCLPVAGIIEPNATKELVVSFSPDHQSQLYADTLDIKLNRNSAYTFDIVGKAWGNNMYSLVPPKHREDEWRKKLKIQPFQFEYMEATENHPGDTVPPPKALILLFVYHTSQIPAEDYDVMDRVTPPTTGKDRTVSGKGKARAQSALTSRAKIIKEIEVGCIKTGLVKKATGDFSIEPLPTSNPHSKLFTIEPLKSNVEAGATKTVTITFHVPRDCSPKTYEADTNVTLKGDSTQVQQLLLRGLVCE